jgi:hypothetical protein
VEQQARAVLDQRMIYGTEATSMQGEIMLACVGQNGNRAAGVPIVRLKFRHVRCNISSQPMHRIEEEVHVTMLVSGQDPSPRWRLPGEAQSKSAKNRVF